jgi:hypothetical protein
MKWSFKTTCSFWLACVVISPLHHRWKCIKVSIMMHETLQPSITAGPCIYIYYIHIKQVTYIYIMSDFYWVLIRHNIICLYVQIKLNTSKSENKIKQIAEKNGLRNKCHNTVPPQQLHWFRIILGKLDTIQYPHTNRDTTLLYITLQYKIANCTHMYIYIIYKYV